MELLESAVQKLENGSTDEALKILEKLTNSGQDDMLFNVAQVYYNFGFLHEAEQTYSLLLEKYPGEGELLHLQAECFIELGEDLKALELLQSIEQSDPFYLNALLLLADLYQSQGLEEVAEQKLLEAYEVNSNEPVIWYALAEFYHHQGDAYRANLHYERILQKSDFIPDHSIYLHYAESLSLLGQFEKAIPYFEQGLDSEFNLDGLFRLGYTAHKAGNYEKAITTLKKLQVADPQYSTLYPLLASAYEYTGNLDHAISTLKSGLKEDEHNEELYYLLSKMLIQTGSKHEAEHYLTHSFTITPPSLKMSQLYIDLLKEDSRYEDIISHILNVKQQYDEIDPVLDWELAEAYNEVENYSEANALFEKSYPFLKDNSEFLEQYGHFLLQEGQAEKAKLCFKEAMKLNSHLFHLEELILELENRL